jgi:hypothetical protein
VNGAPGALDVSVDGKSLARALPVASVSALLAVASGSHTVHLQLTGATTGGTDVSVQIAAGATATAAALSVPGSSLTSMVLADTGAAPVTGKSKVRVIHLAGSAPPVDIWRTQPDWHTPIRVMFPFAFRATSEYMQSDPGAWSVWATPTTNWSSVLATTGAITVAGGEVVTVVLLDSAGTLQMKALPK